MMMEVFIKKLLRQIILKIKRSRILKHHGERAYEFFLSSHIKSALLKYFLAKYIIDHINVRKAEQLYREAIDQNPKKLKYYSELGRNLTKQRKWQQEVDVLKIATSIRNTDIGLNFRLAMALEKIECFDEAESYYKECVRRKPENINFNFRYGCILQILGNTDAATVFYNKAIIYDKSDESKELGVGIFHERLGDWGMALLHYQEQDKLNPNRALVKFKIGSAFQQTYLWKQATTFYAEALRIEPHHASWYYSLAVVQERLSDWLAAENSYLQAIALNEKNASSLWYRLGYVLAKQAKYKQACDAFIEYYPFDKVLAAYSEKQNSSSFQADRYYQRGYVKECSSDWHAAEKFYSQALLFKNDFSSHWWFRLGYVLSKQGKFKQASKAFVEQKIIQKPYEVSRKAFDTNKSFNQVATYAEYFERKSIVKNSVMYESYGGVGMICNPYAIFLDIIADKRFQHWRHIWVIDDESKIPEKYKELENVFLTKKNSDSYLRYLTTSEYLINNNTFPAYFIRKQEQKYLNTWHGTPLKTLGIDLKGSRNQRSNTARNFLHATHMITPNQHTTDVLINRHGISGVFDGKIAEIGYPRIDLLLNKSDVRKRQIIQLMELDSKKPVVLYAPTYRGLWDSPEIEKNKMISDLKELQSDNCNLVFRGHHLAEQMISKLNLSVSLAPQSLDSCELLSVVDVLVTDYSSIFYDFLQTNKPVIHYIYDYEEYSENRGMYFEKDIYPGHICYTVQELRNVLSKVIDGAEKIDAKYQLAQKTFCLHEDGHATKRAVNFFFFDCLEKEYLIKNKPNKKSLLFYGSPFDQNGITSAIINLTNNIDKSKYEITIVIDKVSLLNIPERELELDRLHKEVNILIRSGRMVTTIEEHWIRSQLNKKNKLDNEEMQQLYEKAFRREFTHIFGYKEFYATIDFNGYSPFWASIFAFGASRNKCIYLHNDMYKEYLLRFPYLTMTFNLYPYFDKLISVSESVSKSNSELLANNYSINKGLFCFCDNPINFLAYDAMSNEILLSDEYKVFVQDKRKKFINVARLSPEKGQVKLIEAFAKAKENHKDISLYIMGKGLLHNTLLSTIKRLKLQKSVVLLGQQSNPYPFIKNADCMVLSSEHEGQGIVLLEALYFGVPCISTDIPGPRSVLENGLGMLVGKKTEDITRGIESFLTEKHKFNVFSAEQYNQNALNMFYDKVAERPVNTNA